MQKYRIAGSQYWKLCLLLVIGLTLPSVSLHAQVKKPNILVIMGDDIGWYNTSIYNRGDMGYQTPISTASAKKEGCF
jgi:hypothetical protein